MSLYKSATGTHHIVKHLSKYREMLRGERLENTAYTYQIVAQRQKWNELFFEDDTDFEPFCMESELFFELYKKME